jgi:hypothetical protein
MKRPERPRTLAELTEAAWQPPKHDDMRRWRLKSPRSKAVLKWAMRAARWTDDKMLAVNIVFQMSRP